jgi:hypothetical protein
LGASNAPNSASTARLGTLATGNNPRFWDPKIRSEQWYDTAGDPFTIQFPAMIEPSGKHSRLDPYFSLPTLKQVRNMITRLSVFSQGCQPELKDVRTVKAQFQLRTLDNGYPAEAIICSKKAANTLMLLVSRCEGARGKGETRIVVYYAATDDWRQTIARSSSSCEMPGTLVLIRCTLWCTPNLCCLRRARLNGKLSPSSP